MVARVSCSLILGIPARSASRWNSSVSHSGLTGVPFAWVTADEAYGQAKWLQVWLEDQEIWYVMAIRCSDTLITPEGEQRADALIVAVLAEDLGRGRGARPARVPLGADPGPGRREAGTYTPRSSLRAQRRPMLPR